MERHDETPVNINPDERTAETNRMHMQPGELGDIENASAYANRTGQHDTTSLRPERAGLGRQDNLQASEANRTGNGDGNNAGGELQTDGRTDPPQDPEGLTSAADPMR